MSEPNDNAELKVYVFQSVILAGWYFFIIARNYGEALWFVMNSKTCDIKNRNAVPRFTSFDTSSFKGEKVKIGQVAWNCND
jgi:hypothetical protein